MNEVFNDGNAIFFYPHEETGIWVTYGYSAYKLAHMDNVNCLSSYSIDMQMPYACITVSDFKVIVKNNMSTIECKDGFYLLLTKEKVDANAYQDWVASLK